MTGNLSLPNLYLNNPTNTTASIFFRPNVSIYSLFSRKVPWAMYFAEDFNTTTNVLPNYLNNGRDAGTPNWNNHKNICKWKWCDW